MRPMVLYVFHNYISLLGKIYYYLEHVCHDRLLLHTAVILQAEDDWKL